MAYTPKHAAKVFYSPLCAMAGFPQCPAGQSHSPRVLAAFDRPRSGTSPIAISANPRQPAVGPVPTGR
jgi:hypothetical protein